MMNNYVVGITGNMALKLVDTKRTPEELDSCVAVSTASWKTMLRQGMRNYFNVAEHNIFDRRPYCFTYGRAGFSTANPGLGDYVAPGFTSISIPLGNAIGEAATFFAKGKFIPINGHKLINGGLKFKNDRNNTSVYLNRGRPCNHTLPGWSIVHRSQRSYIYIERATVTGGISNNNVTRIRLDDRYPDDVVLATQVIQKQFIEGATTIRVEVIGTPLGVLINDNVLSHVGNGVYEYNGPAFECDVTLGIGIGAVGVAGVRILDI